MPAREADLPMGPLAWGVGVLLAVLAGVVAAALLLLDHWHMPLGGSSDGVVVPRLPAPMLETAPQPGKQAYFADKQRRLDSAGWVDQAHGIAHIPLKDAMSMLASGASPSPPIDPPSAATARTSAIPSVSLQPHVGTLLPMRLPFVDSAGRNVKLGAFFDGQRPVVLVLGYARCQTLCGTLQQSILQALVWTRRPPDTFRLLSISIDPRETASDAARHQDALLRAVNWPGSRDTVHALVGPEASIQALTQAVGYERIASDDSGLRDADQEAAPAQYAHPIGFMVTTPDGSLARYIASLQVDPKQLAQALDQARSPLPSQPVSAWNVLRCLHVDSFTTPLGGTVMNGLRIMGVAMVIGLSTWLWRHRKPPPNHDHIQGAGP
ncbi:MAG: hypothetical protein QM749_09675 [Aquabacterium sp.]